MLSPLDWLLGLFSLDIGIDLGTANTLVSVRGKGIVINEPSYAAIEKKTRRPITYGQEAKEMGGKAPSHILVVRPLRDGVISEFEITEGMLHYLTGRAANTLRKLGLKALRVEVKLRYADSKDAGNGGLSQDQKNALKDQLEAAQAPVVQQAQALGGNVVASFQSVYDGVAVQVPANQAASLCWTR